MGNELDNNMLRLLQEVRKGGSPSMEQQENHERLMTVDNDESELTQDPTPSPEGLSPTTIALLKLTPTALVFAVCHNLISRRAPSIPGKVVGYAFATAASYMAFNRASQKLDPSPKNDNTLGGGKEPKHYCL